MYRQHHTNGVLLVETGEHIPATKSDPRWLAYKAWLKQGNIALPAEPELMPLPEVFSRLVSRINQKRNAVEQSYFMYLDKPFDSDSISAIRMTTVASAAQTALAFELEFPPIEWTCHDNTTILMTAEQLAMFPLMLAQHSGACHAVGTAKKGLAQEMFLAGDREGLENFDIDSGWSA